MSNLESLSSSKFRVLAPAEAQEVLGGLAAEAGQDPTLIGGTFLPGAFILDYKVDSTAPAPSEPPKELIA